MSDLEVTIEDGEVELTVTVNDTIVAPNPNQFAIDFAYNNVSSRLIWSGAKRIVRVEMAIAQVFNGAPSQLKIGDLSVQDRLMSASQNNPAKLGVWEAYPFYKYLTTTDIYLFINLGLGCTQGNGTIILYFE